MAHVEQGPRVLKGSERVKLCDISVESGVSGWREPNNERQNELLEVFLAGSYGMSTLSRPTLLMFDGAKKLDNNGNQIIDNGS